MTIRVGCNLLVTDTDATTLAAAYQRAVKARTTGRIESVWEDEHGKRTYWLVDSTSDPGTHHLVKVEQRANGQLRTWCECLAGWRGNHCKHIAFALDRMGLLPKEETA